MKRVELLSPAKNLAIGIAAINNGADAVYIGAPAFGARKGAANSIEDIEALIKYAHHFYCRVFVTLNTILYDKELPEAERLIKRLYDIGADAIIIQDIGILELDLPPISLHASTQMHNYDLDRIRFLDQVGFQRIVLARELSLEQIRVIRREVKAELEVFVHGALCVSMSGQCYLSHYMFGRSANRGECAQPCRMKWSVKDRDGRVIVKDKYILSLKDLNLSSYINDLIEIGVDSFKIEGRLKDEQYVGNVTNYYSSLINQHPEVTRAGSGRVISTFEADPERSFSRGYTSYFVEERQQGMVNMDTPKSVGKRIGIVKAIKGNRFLIGTDESVHNGDGLCYFEKGELKGIKVNSVDKDWIECNEPVKAIAGTVLYRNYDHRFVMQLEKEKSVRKIRIKITVKAEQSELTLCVTDEDGVTARYKPDGHFEKANNPAQMDRIKQHVAKCGDSDFVCDTVDYLSGEILFIPTATLNQARRCLLYQHEQNREKQRPMARIASIDPQVPYRPDADWKHNIVNRNAAQFYCRHGVGPIESGFEINTDIPEKELMLTRYCLLYELDLCRKKRKNLDLRFPLLLYNGKYSFRLEFDCDICFMKIIG